MRWAGFVRNVMLGRDGLDRAGFLRAVQEAGGGQARSYLTTGNVTFDAEPTDLDRMTDDLETRLGRILGRRAMVAIRQLDWLPGLVGTDMFAEFDPQEWELEVSFLPRTAPPIDPAAIADAGRTVIVSIRKHEVATARPREGAGRPHINWLLERATGQNATARAWTTLCRIATDGQSVAPVHGPPAFLPACTRHPGFRNCSGSAPNRYTWK